MTSHLRTWSILVFVNLWSLDIYIWPMHNDMWPMTYHHHQHHQLSTLHLTYTLWTCDYCEHHHHHKLPKQSPQTTSKFTSNYCKTTKNSLQTIAKPSYTTTNQICNLLNCSILGTQWSWRWLQNGAAWRIEVQHYSCIFDGAVL